MLGRSYSGVGVIGLRDAFAAPPCRVSRGPVLPAFLVSVGEGLQLLEGSGVEVLLSIFWGDRVSSSLSSRISLQALFAPIFSPRRREPVGTSAWGRGLLCAEFRRRWHSWVTVVRAVILDKG